MSASAIDFVLPEQPKQRSLLLYIAPSTLIGVGLAVAAIFTAPLGAVIVTAGAALGAVVYF